MKLGEEFCAHDRRPACDVVRACHEVIEACGLPGLSGVRINGSPTLAGCSVLLAKHLLLYTGNALLGRRPPALLWRVLLTCFQICTHWLFPKGAKWRRSSAAVEPLWAACACCRTLVWLVVQGFNKWPAKAAMLLAPEHRQLLWRHARRDSWDPVVAKRALEGLLYLQLQAICPSLGAVDVFDSKHDSLHALYCWCSPCGYYVGIASAVRKWQRHGTGIAARWLEHFTALIRARGPDSHKLRYKIMKRVRIDETFFVVCRMGPENRIRAMESLEIRTRRPNANVPHRPQAKPDSLREVKPRRRPPKHARLLLAHDGPFDSPVVAQAVQGLASFGKPAWRQEMGFPVCRDRLGFDTLYTLLVRERLACCGELGPLDVYDPALAALLLRWCAVSGAEVRWRILEQKWSVTCGPASVVPLMPGLHGQGRKAMATKCLNREFAARQLPGVRGVLVKAPRRCVVPTMRVALRLAVLSCPRWSLGEKAWLLSKVRVVAGSLDKQRDKWNAVQISKKVRQSAVSLELQSYVGRSALKGESMHRVEKVWDVPVRPSAAQDSVTLTSATEKACLQLRLPRSCCSLACREVVCRLPCSREYQNEQAFFRRTEASYTAYTRDMSVEPGLVLVPDDKEKKVFWKMPIDTYMVLLFHFAIISTAWEMVALSVGDAHAWCREVMFTLVPAVVQKFLFLRKYKSFLPYYYGTVKAKCFQNGKKTCSKVGHSCLRKVVSFAAWPFRKRWRVIHRGLETVLRRTGIGDEVWSLEACPILEHRMRFADVAHGDPYCCRCGCPKSDTVAVTADAGQFFEAVQARQAIAAARRVLRKCAAMTNKTCVTVLRGLKRTAFIGGCNRAAYKRGFVFTFMELFLSFAACMFMCYVTLGDIVFRLEGLPIGGVLSKIAASFVLACEEHDWSCDVPRRRRYGYSTVCASWDHEVARARYVDDVLWVSGVYCHDCLAKAIHVCYSVPFEVEPASRRVSWLDLVLDAVDLRWSMKACNWRFPPAWGVPQGYLYGFLSGRLSRWSEVALDQNTWIDAVANLFINLRDAQWTRKHVRSAIFKVATRHGRAKRDLLLLVLQATWQ
jgi:hypothetical protein